MWLTGLSGSGKTTIATELKKLLPANSYVLDGDVLRTGLNSDLGFSPNDRRENIRRAGEVAALLADAGIITICSFISPYRNDRVNCRHIHDQKGIRFFEADVAAPIWVCEGRDPKGLYKRARAGEIKDFTGISAPYEVPKYPDLKLKTHEDTIDQCVAQCIAFLKSEGIIK